MSSQSERQRNNVRAGIFVTVTLLMAVLTVVVLTSAWEGIFSSSNDYIVVYDVSSGVRNLKEGAEVRVGGMSFGQVLSIKPRISEGSPFKQIEVEFSVNSPIEIFANAEILVTSSLIGSEAWLDIPSVGTPDAGPAPADGVTGVASVGALTGLLGPGNASKASAMMDDAKKFTEFMASVPDEYQQRVVPILNNAESATEDMAELAQTVRNENWPGWSANVDRVLDWASSATDDFDAILVNGRGILEENRTKINNTVANIETASGTVKDITETFNTTTLTKLHDFLDKGQATVDGALAVLENVDREFDTMIPGVHDMLANFRLTAQQLKLFSIEIRRSPWMIFYEPSVSDLEHELLYAAARTFASAASDLKASAGSMQRVLDRHGENAITDPKTLQRLNKYLIDSMDDYEKAQQRLIDVIFSDAK